MSAVDSNYAWVRLFVALVLGTIGSVGMWSYVVALPPVQADFGVLRNLASLPYTMAMIGFAFGGVAMGRLADRHGIVFPAITGTLLTAVGFLAAGYAPNIWVLSAAHVVIGFGCSGTFGPIVSDMSHWFRKRRGIAIGIASCGGPRRSSMWMSAALPRLGAHSDSSRTPCRRCWRWPALHAASRWLCRRYISSPTARTSATGSHAAPRCCR